MTLRLKRLIQLQLTVAVLAWCTSYQEEPEHAVVFKVGPIVIAVMYEWHLVIGVWTCHHKELTPVMDIGILPERWLYIRRL